MVSRASAATTGSWARFWNKTLSYNHTGGFDNAIGKGQIWNKIGPKYARDQDQSGAPDDPDRSTLGPSQNLAV